MNNVNLFIEKPLRKMTDHIDHFLKDWKVYLRCWCYCCCRCYWWWWWVYKNVGHCSEWPIFSPFAEKLILECIFVVPFSLSFKLVNVLHTNFCVVCTMRRLPQKEHVNHLSWFRICRLIQERSLKWTSCTLLRRMGSRRIRWPNKSCGFSLFHHLLLLLNCYILLCTYDFGCLFCEWKG